FFFFQAEDGIRDLTVTGVQTCALPIFLGGDTYMQNTIRAVVRDGRIELPEDVEIPEGTEVLITPLVDEPDFWLSASQSALDSVRSEERRVGKECRYRR